LKKGGVNLLITGYDAVNKARKTADALLTRTRSILKSRMMADFTEVRVELIGGETAQFGGHAQPVANAPRECVMVIRVKHSDPKALAILNKECPSAATSFSPGTTGFGAMTGSKPAPIEQLFSFFIPKADVNVSLVLDGPARTLAVPVMTQGGFTKSASYTTTPPMAVQEASPWQGGDKCVTIPLIKAAYGRSGDKGSTCNIGVIARDPSLLPYLRHQLSADRVKSHFSHNTFGTVERFDMPGINGMNFYLKDTLGGGGMASLHGDPLGKCYFQVLSCIQIDIPARLLHHCTGITVSNPSPASITPAPTAGTAAEEFGAGGCLLDLNGGVATITLARPKKRNAIDTKMMDNLMAATRLLAGNKDIRVVILKAQGEFFCAGGDSSSFRKASQGSEGGAAAKANASGANDLAKVFNAIATLPQFTVAMAQGPAMGGGVGLLSMTDMTVAVEKSWFSLSEVKLGVIPATISPYVVGKIGVANAKRLFCTAERFSATKAKEYGLVQEVVEDEAAMNAFVQNLCKDMTLCAPGAVAASKKLIEGVAGKPITPELIAYTAGELAKVRVTDECKEGFSALIEKRKPAWTKAGQLSAKL